MTINNNINNYQVDNSTSTILEKVASSLEINKASDNASSLTIADQLRNQKTGISQAIENVNSGIALTNIADSGLNEQKSILENIKNEIIKANNGTLNTTDRENIANQITKYVEQFNAIAEQTNYNGKNLLQTSTDLTENDLTISTEDGSIGLSTADTKNITDTMNGFMEQFSTSADARNALFDTVNNGIDRLNNFQSDFASAANQLESSLTNYLSDQTNIANGESQIRDLNYASIMETFSKADIQGQIGSFLQSQANASSMRVLQLLS